MDILVTEDFDRTLNQLSASMRNTVKRKIRSLAENKDYPSLKTHRLHQVKGKKVWDCSITDSMRMLFEIQAGILHLWDLGPHAIVDKVHLRGFASHTRFHHNQELISELPWSETATLQELEPKFEPIEYSYSKAVVESQQGFSNCFQFFQNAHLRVLGVPANLIQSLKSAQTLEDALTIPGLTERTRTWLEELSTSPELEPILFDSSRLLFRTTLDRLEGYCEGKIKRLMLNLQRPEQQRYVDMEGESRILLKGAAGSGKTTVGIYRAIRLASEGKHVLVLTFNRTLSSATKSLIEELIGPLPSNLEVTTLHSLMMGILYSRSVSLNIPKKEQAEVLRECIREAMNIMRKKNNARVLNRDENFFEEEIRRVIKGFDLKSVEEYKEVKRYGRKTALKPSQREVVWMVYEVYQQQLLRTKYNDWADVSLRTLQTLQERTLSAPYDDIIVDEAQDLTPVDLRVINRLISVHDNGTSGSSSILILGDVAQTLYSRSSTFEQAGIQGKLRTGTLRKNYRNTRQIAEAAAHLLEQNTLMRSANDYVDPEWTQRQGPFPILLKATSSYGQIELIRNCLLDLVGDQTFRLADFAVLCRTNQLCRRCKNDFEQAGLRTVHHQDSDFDLLEERIKILTIHSAKGLEFPVVFLLGLTEGEIPLAYDKNVDQDPEEEQLHIEQERTLCYVGMTRAAEALYLLTTRGRESRFINELEGKIIN